MNKSFKRQGKLTLISQGRPYDSKPDGMTETAGRVVKHRAGVRTCNVKPSAPLLTGSETGKVQPH